jgi:hypothetical protein
MLYYICSIKSGDMGFQPAGILETILAIGTEVKDTIKNQRGPT